MNSKTFSFGDVFVSERTLALVFQGLKAKKLYSEKNLELLLHIFYYYTTDESYNMRGNGPLGALHSAFANYSYLTLEFVILSIFADCVLS